MKKKNNSGTVETKITFPNFKNITPKDEMYIAIIKKLWELMYEKEE